jgi:hypothetical protein
MCTLRADFAEAVPRRSSVTAHGVTPCVVPGTADALAFLNTAAPPDAVTSAFASPCTIDTASDALTTANTSSASTAAATQAAIAVLAGGTDTAPAAGRAATAIRAVVSAP